jgi:hypothetical protein
MIGSSQRVSVALDVITRFFPPDNALNDETIIVCFRIQ